MNKNKILFLRDTRLYLFALVRNDNLHRRVVAVSSTSSEDNQKSDEKNNASNNEQVQWAISVSDNTNNQPAASNDEQHSIHENSRFLRALTNYIVKRWAFEIDVQRSS